MEGEEFPSATRCLGCHALTSRTCSVCNVCVFCSPECEAQAGARNFAGVACNLHLAWTREQTHIGPVGARFVMLPSVDTPLSTKAPAHERWTALHQAAVHYLHALLACQPSRLFFKTAIGMSVVLTTEKRYSCGYQRLTFLMGKTSEAARTMVANMGKLAVTQLGEERIRPPRLRDSDTPQDARQVVFVSGFVAKSKGEQSHEAAQPVVHFDAIYLTHTKGVWTIRRVQPLWEQRLTTIDDTYYHMHYKPQGRVPPNARHPLELVEKALSPPPPTEPAPPTPNLTPTPATSTPPAAPLPSATAPAPAAQTEAPPAPAPGATPRPTFPLPQREPRSWEEYRAQALAQAQAATEAPPWMAQLQEALPGPRPSWT